MARGNHKGGAEQSKLTRLVIQEYGDICWLQLPGCSKRATTKDHVIPVAAGGDDSLDNLRPACSPCNSRRQDLAISGTPGGITVVVVLGPPAAGKTSYVMENAKKGDIVIDLDRIAGALMPGDVSDKHGYPHHIRHIAIGARTAAINRALRTRHPCTVWLIHAIPSREQLQQYARLRYQIRTVDPGRAVVEQRAQTGRGREERQGIGRWYHRYPDGPASVELIAARRPIASTIVQAAKAADQTPSRPW